MKMILPRRLALVFLGLLTIFVFFTTVYVFRFSDDTPVIDGFADFQKFQQQAVEPPSEQKSPIITENPVLNPQDLSDNKDLLEQFSSELTGGSKPKEEIREVSREPLQVPKSQPVLPPIQSEGRILSSNSTKQCKAYVGRTLAVDNQGNVCKVGNVDHNRCCPEPRQQYSCESCNTYDCCTAYEMCVSCCLDPKRSELIQGIFAKGRGEQLYKRVKV
jgi:hypothetical protein